ncbi:hypothetical protein AgCh_010533 [Apium graveolens]
MDQVPDRMPPERQPRLLQEANSILNTYVGFSDGVARYNYDSHLEKSKSGYINDDNATEVVSGSLTSTLSPGWKSNSTEKTIGESNRIRSSKHEFETFKGPDLSNLHTSSPNAEKQMDVSDCLLGGVSSDHIEKDTAFSPGITIDGASCSRKVVQSDEGREVGRDIGVNGFYVHESEPSFQHNNARALLSQRRSRKPTLRYIEESSEPNSKCSKKTRKVSTSLSGTKSPGVGSNVIKSRTPVLCSDEPFMVAIQVPFDSQVQVPVESQKQVPVECQKQVPVDSRALVPADSQKQVPGDSQVRKECRKQNALIEYGVGKWTDIKRDLFSSSAHRTTVDLKDKWRNLIKASCAEEQRMKEMHDKKGRNQPWRPLPKSILRRVRELAMMYPCPYNGNSEDLHVFQDSSPSCSAITNCSPLKIGEEKSA